MYFGKGKKSIMLMEVVSNSTLNGDTDMANHILPFEFFLIFFNFRFLYFELDFLIVRLVNIIKKFNIYKLIEITNRLIGIN